MNKKTIKDSKGKIESSSTENGHIDQIRDILFGDQIRNIHEKTEQLKIDIHNDLSDFKEEQKEYAEELETKFKKEINQLNNRIEENSQELKTIIEELRNNLLEEIKNIANETSDNNKKMINTFQEQIQQLDKNKADRRILAKFFSDIARRLSDETNPIPEHQR